jgi:hypothetical protein
MQAGRKWPRQFVSYGQVNLAFAVTATDILGPVVEFADAIAITSTVPEAPGTHCARPDWEIVATAGFDTDQVPVYGSTNGTTAGDGAWLKVPKAMNCTLPAGDFAASATAGVRVMD